MNFQKRKRTVSSSAALQADPSSRQKVHSLFEKKFTYPDNEAWTFPVLQLNNIEEYELPDLKTLKDSLNNVKESLSDKDIVQWHEHTCFMNLAGSVNRELQNRFRPELCTQAWCKFYEILSSYNIVDLSSIVFNTVHLCEAPGAFVTSLNHYLHSHGFKGNWNWVATTLNPYYEGNTGSAMVMDDRLILESFENWDFGINDTGNIMQWCNVEHLMTRCENLQHIHMVTCDGSIDCQDTPSDQEKVVSRLHCCEALAAMLILSPGGTLVLKKFTMFESETISLMYLLNCCFNQVHMFKPATSKCGNSEVYVICTGYKAEEFPQLKEFSKLYFSNTDSMQGLVFQQSEIPSAFLSAHFSCCDMFVNKQKSAILHNLDHYPSVSEQYLLWTESMKELCADLYVNKYHVTKIPDCCRITRPPRKSKLKGVYKKGSTGPIEKWKRMHSGTFLDRQRSYAMPWDQKVHLIQSFEELPTEITWCTLSNQHIIEKEVQDWACSEGSPVLCLTSSIFCDNKLLKISQEIFMKAKVAFYQSTLDNVTSMSTVSMVIETLRRESWIPENRKYTVVIVVYDSQDRELLSMKSPTQKEKGNLLSNVADNDTESKEKENSDFVSNVTMTDNEPSDYTHEESGSDLLQDCASQNKSDEITDNKMIDKVLHFTYSSPSMLSVADSREGTHLFYLDLCPLECNCETEIQNQNQMLAWFSHFIKVLQISDCLVIKMTTCLTRFTAGLVFVLCHCFSSVGFLPHPIGASLQQVMICCDFVEVPAWAGQHLEYLQSRTQSLEQTSCSTGSQDTIKDCGNSCENKHNVILETVPMHVLLTNRNFMESLKKVNETILKSFVNEVGNKERQLYTKDNSL